jgi:predicted amidohydrolase YtcJ
MQRRLLLAALAACALPQFAQAAVQQADLILTNAHNDDITTAVGPETIKRVWPVREMLDAEALVVPGSDWSIVPSVSPWIGIETLVTREKPGGSAASFGKGEAITLNEAFKLFTENSAKQEGASSLVGRIEPGMLADIIVVDRNPFAIPVTEIHATKVKMTFIAGEKVFDASNSKSP